MDNKVIESALKEVLQAIQATSDLACPPLVGTTKPLEDLPEFDSKIWPVAVGMLAVKLGVTIANDVNIFREDGAAVALTISEVVAKVAAIVNAQTAAKQASGQ